LQAHTRRMLDTKECCSSCERGSSFRGGCVDWRRVAAGPKRSHPFASLYRSCARSQNCVRRALFSVGPWFFGPGGKSLRAGLLPALTQSALSEFPILIMATSLKKWGCAAVAVLSVWSVSPAQTSPPNPAPSVNPATVLQPPASLNNLPTASAKGGDKPPLLLVQASAAAASPAPATTTT